MIIIKLWTIEITIISNIFFCSFAFSSAGSVFDRQRWILNISPRVIWMQEALFIFLLSFFSLFLSPGNFYSSLFKVTFSFVCQLTFNVESGTTQKIHFFVMTFSPFFLFDLNWPHLKPWLICIPPSLGILSLNIIKPSRQWGSDQHEKKKP